MPRNDAVSTPFLGLRLVAKWRQVLAEYGFEECGFPLEYINDKLLHGVAYFRNIHNFVIAVSGHGHESNPPGSISFFILYGRGRCRLDARDNFSQEVKRIKNVLKVLKDPVLLPTYVGDEGLSEIVSSWCKGEVNV